MEFLFVLSGAFAILFFLLLVSKSKKQYEHWFLAIIFLLITINSFYVFQFYRSDSFYYVPFFSELNYALPLLYGTLLWFYTKSLTKADYKFRFFDLLHFLPFIAFFAILIIPLISSYHLISSRHVGYPLIKLIITPAYLFAVLIILKKYRAGLNNQFAYDQKVTLHWLSWITLGAISLWLIALAGFIYNSINNVNKTLLYDYYVLSFLALFLFVLAYVALTRTDIFHKNPEEVTPQKLVESDSVELKNQSFEKEDLVRLQAIMEDEKPYLDPYLNINKLAEISRIPQYKISRILNVEMKLNFYDFINGYRVNEVKRRLESGETNEYSILGIASEAGFNSKASFNRVFKKLAGMTPSQFLREISQ